MPFASMSLVGASGVLGSAVRRIFETHHIDVLPLAFSREGEGLVKLDLTKKDQVRAKFEEFKPHCMFSRAGNGPGLRSRLTAFRGYSLRCREKT
jgi:dTDP-4-dehydrorhamnose reductase